MAILAKGDVAVHRLLGPEEPGQPAPVETRVLSDGESLPDGEVPKYLLDAVKDGGVENLVHVSDKEAAKVASEKAAEGAASEGKQEINASNAEADADKA